MYSAFPVPVISELYFVRVVCTAMHRTAQHSHVNDSPCAHRLLDGTARLVVQVIHHDEMPIVLTDVGDHQRIIGADTQRALIGRRPSVAKRHVVVEAINRLARLVVPANKYHLRHCIVVIERGDEVYPHACVISTRNQNNIVLLK